MAGCQQVFARGLGERSEGRAPSCAAGRAGRVGGWANASVDGNRLVAAQGIVRVRGVEVDGEQDRVGAAVGVDVGREGGEAIGFALIRAFEGQLGPLEVGREHLVRRP